MARTVKSLTGAEKDAYLRRVAEAESAGAPADAVASRLAVEVTRVWVRENALAPETPGADVQPESEPPAASDFDPFTPNVVVVLRRGGKDQALTALQPIAPENLKLLAREQQLGIDPELTEAAEIRAAIVAAAERRIANRRAAAS